MRGYQELMRERAERLDDECWRVADAIQPGSSEKGFDRAHLISIRKFIERLGVYAVTDAAEMAYQRVPWVGDRRFRYFCGVCWKMIREQDDARPQP